MAMNVVCFFRAIVMLLVCTGFVLCYAVWSTPSPYLVSLTTRGPSNTALRALSFSSMSFRARELSENPKQEQ